MRLAGACHVTYDKERVVGLLQHPILGHRVLDLVLLDDDFLLEDLDGEELAGGLLAAQNDLSERSLAEDFQKLKVLQCLERSERSINCPDLFDTTMQLTTFVFPLTLPVDVP